MSNDYFNRNLNEVQFFEGHAPRQTVLEMNKPKITVHVIEWFKESKSTEVEHFWNA